VTAAAYTSDLTDIFLFQSTTSVSAYGGGGAGLGTGVDFAMEGTLAVDKQIGSGGSGAEKGFLYDNTSNFTIGADDHFFIWIMLATPGTADSRDNRGIVGCIGDSTSAFVKFHLHGNDTLPLGGGRSYALRFDNTTLSNFRTLVGSPGTTPSWIGGGANTTAAAKAANLGVDGARIGTGYDVTGGTGADPEANFAGIAADDESTSEGIFQTAPGGYTWKGKLRIGNSGGGGTPCEFLDSNALLQIEDTRHSLADFTEMLLEDAASILTLDRVTFLGLGTNNPGRFEMITSAATANLTDCTFQDFGDTVLGTGATFLRVAWINADVVTANGADLSGSSVSGFEGADDTAALLWNTATDPDGLLDDMTFTQESGVFFTHAIEFTSSAPLTQTINGMVANGYHASDGNDDSTFLFADRGSDVTWTLNIIGGSGNFSYKKARAGDTVIIVLDPVTALVRVTDENADDFQSVRVLLEAGDGTGDLPFEDTVTITRVSSTASVAHTTHGMSSGAKVAIRNSAQPEYNGVFAISNVTTNAYDYTVTGTPDTPATIANGKAAITATGVVFEGLTDVNGEISASMSYSVDQNVRGKARRSTTSPLYKTADFTDVIDSVDGLTKGIQMIRDD